MELFGAIPSQSAMAERTPGIRKAFSAWCRMRARAALYEQRADMPQEMFRESLELLDAAIAAHSYDWRSPARDADRHGKGMLRLLQDTDGQVKILQLFLQPAHGDVPEDKVLDIMEADGVAVGRALREAMGMDPNPPTPAPNTASGTDSKTASQTTTAT